MAMEDPLLPPLATSTSATDTTAVAAGAIPDDTAATPSTTTIVARLAAVVALAAISVWANYEASKGFEISVLNAAAGSPMGDRFGLMFVSDGRASRIICDASQFVERALYPSDLYPRKQVRRLTLLMASHNLSTTMWVTAADADPGHYTVHLSLGLMSTAAKAADAALAATVHRAVARVWLWDGQRTAPAALIDAVAEYLAAEAGFPTPSKAIRAASLESHSCCWSEGFLRYCEERSNGFVAKLNRAMRERWAEGAAVEDWLGSPVRQMCEAYRSSAARRIGRGESETGHVM